MIISVDDLRKQVDCGTDPDDLIIVKLNAIESVIRAFTNNNFQQRNMRFAGESDEQWIYGDTQYFKPKDTVQISASGVNDGLYIVTMVDGDRLAINAPIFPARFNLVTKIKYPPDVKQCAIDLYKWKQTMGGKVGIKSETLSRHSVTYEDGTSLFMGYPIGILNGLALYKKARC